MRGVVTSEREQLEAAIDEAVDDAARYAVLSDFLSQQGDPRGELIALQLEAQRTKAGRAREAELLATRGIRIRGAQRAQWRWGYIDTLLFELVRHDAWEAHRDDWPRTLLEPELQHPSCRFLRELVIDASPGDRAVEFLREALPRHVRALSLITNELELRGLGGKLAQLQRLSLSVQLVTGHGVDLPALTELALPLDAIRAVDLHLLLGALPRLESLTVSSLETVDAEALSGLASARLSSLRIRADRTTRSAVESLLETPLRQTLRRLDVQRSGLTEEAAQRLLKLVPKFERLSDLILGE